MTSRTCLHFADVTSRTCLHFVDNVPSDALLMSCSDCGAECSGDQVGDDRLCYDPDCPLHVRAGQIVVPSDPTRAQLLAATDKAYKAAEHVAAARKLLRELVAMGINVDLTQAVRPSKSLQNAADDLGDLVEELEEAEYEAGMAAGAYDEAASS